MVKTYGAVLKPICLMMVCAGFSIGCNGRHPTENSKIPSQQIDVDKEIGSLREQLKVNPQSADLHEQIGVLSGAKHDWATCDEELATAISLDPDNITDYVNAAEAFTARGMNDKALAMMNTAVARDPENPWGLFIRGTLDEKTGNTQNANLDFENAAALVEKLKSRSNGPHISGNSYFDKNGHEYRLDMLEKSLNARFGHAKPDPN